MEIKKHLKITGNSSVSWKDAIDGDKIVEYYVDLDVSFVVDLSRTNN